MRQYRQGDVLIREISPELIIRDNMSWHQARPVDDNILAFGEGSGHAHLVEFPDDVDGAVEDVYAKIGRGGAARRRVITVGPKGATLVHRHMDTGEPTGDHDDIGLEPGTYELVPQNEWDENKAVRVVD